MAGVPLVNARPILQLGLWELCDLVFVSPVETYPTVNVKFSSAVAPSPTVTFWV